MSCDGNFSVTLRSKHLLACTKEATYFIHQNSMPDISPAGILWPQMRRKVSSSSSCTCALSNDSHSRESNAKLRKLALNTEREISSAEREASSRMRNWMIPRSLTATTRAWKNRAELCTPQLFLPASYTGFVHRRLIPLASPAPKASDPAGRQGGRGARPKNCTTEAFAHLHHFGPRPANSISDRARRLVRARDVHEEVAAPARKSANGRCSSG